MKPRVLLETAQAVVAGGKGLLAMDESNSTCNKRFASAGIAQTLEMRRAYRELLLTTPELSKHISGVILFDETLGQAGADGGVFVRTSVDAGILVGINVDTGAKALAAHAGEQVTEGLDGLLDRWQICPPARSALAADVLVCARPPAAGAGHLGGQGHDLRRGAAGLAAPRPMQVCRIDRRL